MSEKLSFSIDGVQVEANKGETILQAADRAGIYIPRMCVGDSSQTAGTCRICTVYVHGKARLACLHPAEDNIVVENDTERLYSLRQSLMPRG